MRKLDRAEVHALGELVRNRALGPLRCALVLTALYPVIQENCDIVSRGDILELMLSTLLPGVRELRTPLATGVLWAAAFWLLFGDRIASSPSTEQFFQRVESLGLSSSVWLGASVFAAYLVGSLLVVRSSPFRWLEWSRPVTGVRRLVDRLNEGRPPDKRRWLRPLTTFWEKRVLRGRWHRLSKLGTDAVESSQPIDTWLGNEFDLMARKGVTPVTRSWEPSCETRFGFEGMFATDTIRESDAGDEFETQTALRESYVRNIKEEQTAVEVRIQMRFPQVYMEIDRVRAEGELRLSVFWPMLVVIGILAIQWSPWIVTFVTLPIWLVLDGFQRLRDADEQTWVPVMAGEITSPLMDLAKGSEGDPPGDFMAAFYPELQST